MTSLHYKIIDSRVGKLTLVGDDSALVAVLWEKDRPKRVPLTAMTEHAAAPILLETETQLRDYFAGVRRTFDLPLRLAGTAFQQKVWTALRDIPYGEVRSYGDIARMIGAPDAVRAVGAANGRNPISIIVPCHRVVGADGKLTGFAGGIDAKAHLLALECPQPAQAALF